MTTYKKQPIPDQLRRKVFERDKYTCRYCLKPVGKPHCDHVFPERYGGPTTFANLATACRACNLHKRDKIGVWPLPLNMIELTRATERDNSQRIDTMSLEFAVLLERASSANRTLLDQTTAAHEKEIQRLHKQAADLREHADSQSVKIAALERQVFGLNRDVTEVERHAAALRAKHEAAGRGMAAFGKAVSVFGFSDVLIYPLGIASVFMLLMLIGMVFNLDQLFEAAQLLMVAFAGAAFGIEIVERAASRRLGRMAAQHVESLNGVQHG